MKHNPHVFPAFVRNFFFLLGLSCALAFRIIIVAEHIDPFMVRVIWYAAVLGYIFFFLYRYYITFRRRRAISEYSLVEKIERGEALQGEEKEAASYILKSLMRSPEGFNYVFIVVVSFLAIAADIWMSVHDR